MFPVRQETYQNSLAFLMCNRAIRLVCLQIYAIIHFCTGICHIERTLYLCYTKKAGTSFYRQVLVSFSGRFLAVIIFLILQGRFCVLYIVFETMYRIKQRMRENKWKKEKLSWTVIRVRMMLLH